MQSVHRASEGTTRPFDRLVEPHLAALFTIAQGIVKSPDLAWDAVQEALVCLWTGEAAPPDVRGWLVRTVVHKSLHVSRSHARASGREARASAMRPETCPLCDPPALLEQEETRAELECAIEALSEELRIVFVMRQEIGLDYAEIAARLAVPIGTVRSRLSRARAALVARLIDPESGELPAARWE